MFLTDMHTVDFNCISYQCLCIKDRLKFILDPYYQCHIIFFVVFLIKPMFDTAKYRCNCFYILIDILSVIPLQTVFSMFENDYRNIF